MKNFRKFSHFSGVFLREVYFIYMVPFLFIIRQSRKKRVAFTLFLCELSLFFETIIYSVYFLHHNTCRGIYHLFHLLDRIHVVSHVLQMLYILGFGI